MFKDRVLKAFLDVLLQFGDRSAFCINGNFYTYTAFAERVSTIKWAIREVDEDIIGVITNDDIDTYAAIFAIWFEGKSYVPINPLLPIERNVSVVSQVNIGCLLNSGDQNVDELVYGLGVSVIECGALENRGVSLSVDKVSDDQIAYILFTSGSTGVPKGVPITKFNLSSFVDAVFAMGYDIDETDRCLQMFELTFDLSVFSYLVPLIRGACVYTIPKDKIKYSYIYQLMDEEELTVALMVPSMLGYFRPYFDEIECPRIRYSLFCGEALHSDITDEWAKCVPNARIDNVYGPTENTIFCTYYTYNREFNNDSHNGVLSIGVDMVGCITAIVDECGEISKIGTVGELCLGGSQLTMGYVNNSTLNETQFFEMDYMGKIERFYRSGDLCFFNDHGNIEYVGRKDHQVKIQGYRVELSEIEYHAKKSVVDKLNMVAVAMDNGSNDTNISIVIESAEQFDTTDMVKYMKEKMPSYMIPSKISFMDAFPLNSSGKIDRKEIKKSIC